MKLRKRNGIWTLDLRAEGGTRVSLKTRDKDEAKRRAQQVLTSGAAISGRPAAQPASGVQGHSSAPDSAGVGPTLGDVYRAVWTAHWSRLPSSKEVQRAWRRIAEVLPEETPLADLRHSQLEGVARSLEAKGLSGSTVNRQLSTLAKLISYASERMGLELASGLRMPWRKERPQERRPATVEEEEHLLAALRGSRSSVHQRTAGLFTVLADSGMRLAEGLALCPQWCDFTQGLISIPAAVTKTTKARTVPMTGRVKAALQGAGPSDPKAPYFPLEKRQAARSMEWAKAAIGLTDRGVVIHSFRHGLVTRLLNGGADLKSVQQWAGHSQVSTTMRYAHASVGRLKQIAELLER
jgi:site-specific recombinase XerD